MFWQEPRTKWWRSIALLVLGYAVYFWFRKQQWNVMANVVGIVFVVWLLLPYRSFLPIRLRGFVGEDGRK